LFLSHDSLYHHIGDVLDLALFPPDVEPRTASASLKALKVLTKNNELIVDALFGTDILNAAADRIIQKADPWYFNRLATVTQVSALNRPDQVAVRCPYITRLLAFVAERGVLDFFEAILRKDDAIARTLQPNLQPSVFLMAFFTQMQTTGQEYENAVTAGDDGLAHTKSSCLTGLFKLVPTVLTVPCFQSELQSVDPINLLVFPWTKASVQLKNAQWSAVASLITGLKAVAFFEKPAYVDSILALFGDQEYGFLPCHESALKVLAEGVASSESLRARLTESNFFYTLASFVSVWATHGICHSAILSFLEVNMGIPEVWQALTTPFLEMALQGFGEELPIEFRSFAWKTVKMIYDVQPLVMDGIQGPVRADIEALRAVVDTPYGGTVPTEASLSDPALAAFLSALAKK
jgi:hypothetical protein